MNVVVVGGCLPYPANSGNRIRTLNLLVRLARRHRITYIATRNPDRAEARAAVAHLSDHGIEPVEVEHTVPPKSGARFYARLAANIASPWPYSVVSHHAPALSRAVRRRAARGDVDLWQAEWAAGMEAFRTLPGARTLVVAHNVETLIWQRYAETETHPLKRLYIRGQCRKFERFERQVLAEAGRVVAVSPDDAALIVHRFGVPADRVDVVDNGIDRAAFEDLALTPAPDHDPKRLLFLGSLEWRPNLDAVGLLLDRIFPAVRAAEPAATLDLVGRNPPAALVRRVAGTPRVTLYASVADVRPHLTRAGVMAVPLRVGGGSRLKILEALAAGLPVVSTRVGAEGLDLVPGKELVVVDDVAAMAAALVGTLRDPATARARAAEGRQRVLHRYDWDTLADRMEQSWERCVGARSVAVSGV
jgi:glycosyltransferase involved in cell wall biosynthesis